ncbi:MAG: hypothetical protein KKB50_06055 [Planctomycetes bacterium]|nr:hypothetical protein [Planctomycetota bacterium]
MYSFLLILVLCCQVGRAPAQAQDDEQDGQGQEMRSLRQNVGRLLGGLRELGSWDEHYEYMLAAAEKVYDRNGWDSEPDRFSLDVFREVGAIPPWAMQERFDTLIGVVSDRYMLSEDQERVLRRTVAQESLGIWQRHSGRILSYALEAIQTRAAGEAITPEQIARWTQMARPVFDDTKVRLNIAAERFMEQLDPEQREIAQEDLGAANRRVARMDELSRKWEQGEWEPSDWGLDEDPIQIAGEARAAAQTEETRPPETDEGAPDTLPERPTLGESRAALRRPAGAADRPTVRQTEPRVARDRESPTRVLTHADEDDPWARYVRSFIEKYKLNEAQQQTAWRIYESVKVRGDRLRQRFGEQRDALRQKLTEAQDNGRRAALAQQDAQQQAALDRLFEQMKRRLERLPTRAQRKNATPAKAATPGRPAEQQPHDGP